MPLGNIIVNPSANITIVASESLDDKELGGKFSLYSGPLIPGNPSTPVNFKVS